jgi:hypothetical protein
MVLYNRRHIPQMSNWSIPASAEILPPTWTFEVNCKVELQRPFSTSLYAFANLDVSSSISEARDALV